jgi:transposase
MKNEVHYLLNQKQITKFQIISNLIEGNLTAREASKSLDLSERQIYRLKKGVKTEGVAFLVHKNTKNKPPHTLDDDFKQKILELKRSEDYKDANFSHFKDLILDNHKISISYSALYTLLSSNGILSPKKRRKPKLHHRRKRRSKKGQLIQIDATPFEWFGGNEKFALHGGIDDASGEITGLYITKNECLHGYFEIARQTVLNHGIPAALYSDRHSIFRSPNASKISIEDQLAGQVINDTQFGRAMKELGIAIIYARSAQAKGRVERLWKTLQDRLSIELKIAGITTVKEANEFLVDYIPQFNSRFAVEPEDPTPAYRQLAGDAVLDHILCVKQTRTTDNSSVVSIHNKHFQILQTAALPEIPKRSKVSVIISTSVGVKVQYQGNVYEIINFIKPKKVNTTKNTAKPRTKYSPPDNHYFKYGKDKFKKVYFDDSYEDVLGILQEIFLRKYA